MKSHTLQELKSISNKYPIIVFDGECNMCNGYIQWLIKRDKKKIFRYTTLQSEEGATLKKASGIAGDTVLLIHNEEVSVMSDVGLRVFRILGGGWTIASWLLILPKGLRDFVYKWIAKNRYNWFGRSDACMVPDASIRSLFI